jgi:hypothetical protein
LEDSDDAFEACSHFPDVKNDVHVLVHGLEESDKLIWYAKSAKPFPQE